MNEVKQSERVALEATGPEAMGQMGPDLVKMDENNRSNIQGNEVIPQE